MSEQPPSQSVEPADPLDGPLNTPGEKATPLQMVLGGVFLVVCIAVCGGFFGWFGKDDAPRGIGVPREAVTSIYNKTGFAFRPAPDYRGFPAEEATSPDGEASIRLVGPRDDLVYASISTRLNPDLSKDQQQYHTVMVVGFLCVTVPEWNGKGQEAMEWLNGCMAEVEHGQFQSETVMKQGRVRFSLTPNPPTMTVSVESKDW